MKMGPRYLILLACAAALPAAIGLFGGCPASRKADSEPGTPAGQAASAQRQVPVVVTPATLRQFEDSLTVQGNLEAKEALFVPARIGGPIENIFVEEGDTVVAGETKLFNVDALKIEEAVKISRQDLNVAKCGLREKEANLERIQVEFDKAEIDYGRFKRLFAKKAVTPDTFEKQESRYKQTKVMVKHAHTLIDLGKEQVLQAESALAIAEKSLSDTVIYAPINGRVSMKLKEVGEYGEAGKPVLRIEDSAVIEVSVFLPAQYYARVEVGGTPMRIEVAGTVVGEYAVSYKSPTIQPKLRTFEAKCLIVEPQHSVVPGAMAEVTILLDRQEGLGIPRDAVQKRNDRMVVFVVENDTARMVEVQTGMETDGWVQITSDVPPEGAPVVTMGQYMVDDGTRVAVQKEGA